MSICLKNGSCIHIIHSSFIAMLFISYVWFISNFNSYFIGYIHIHSYYLQHIRQAQHSKSTGVEATRKLPRCGVRNE